MNRGKVVSKKGTRIVMASSLLPSLAAQPQSSVLKMVHAHLWLSSNDGDCALYLTKMF